MQASADLAQELREDRATLAFAEARKRHRELQVLQVLHTDVDSVLEPPTKQEERGGVLEPEAIGPKKKRTRELGGWRRRRGRGGRRGRSSGRVIRAVAFTFACPRARRRS